MNDINELRNLLISLNGTLEKLLEVENKKTTVLEKGNVDELDSLINTEQAFLMECSSAEKQRIRICEKLQVQTISELLEKNPESKDKLGDIHAEMLDVISSIKKVNTLNIKLLDTRLKIVKFMTSQLGIAADNIKYDKNAKTL